MSDAQNFPSPIQTASLLRRLVAGVYDSFVIMAIVMMAGFLYLGIYQKITGTLNASAHPTLLQLTLFPLILLACLSFYIWCWTHGGSTLGMQAWRIRLISQTGQAITLKQCMQRSALACLSFACFGLGYWSALWHREKLSWHDRGSKTRVIWIGKK